MTASQSGLVSLLLQLRSKKLLAGLLTTPGEAEMPKLNCHVGTQNKTKIIVRERKDALAPGVLSPELCSC